MGETIQNYATALFIGLYDLRKAVQPFIFHAWINRSLALVWRSKALRVKNRFVICGLWFAFNAKRSPLSFELASEV